MTAPHRVAVAPAAQPRRPWWLLWIGAVVMAALTARLGVWQLSRAHEKDQIQALQEQQTVLPELTSADLASDARAASAQHYRRARIEGRWLPDATLYLDNRVMDGRTGFVVVTPLVLDDGSAVLVQRGWIPRHQTDRDRLIKVPTPTGPVRLVTRVAPWPSRLYEFGPDGAGGIRQNVDPAVQAQAWRVALRPMSLQQLALPPTPGGEGVAAEDPLLRDWPKPALTVHRNYGYAAQWFGLSALVLGLTVWFAWWQPRRRCRG